jgi:predicted nucleic acid-binding Zn ribbon protein
MSEVLSCIIDEYNLEKSFTIESIREKWSDIVGDIISAHSIPERIQNGIIHIAVDHSVYSNEISLMKDVLIQKISERSMNVQLKGIRITVKRLDWTK